jgi:hypothetical protein
MRVTFLAALAAALGASAVGYAQVAPAGSLWDLSLGVNEAWISHLRLASPDDPPDLVSRFSARLSRVRNTAHSQLSLGASGSALVYRELTNLNRFNYAGFVTGSWQMSPTTTLTFGDDLTAAYTYDHSLLTETGTSVPLVLAHSNRGRAGVSHVFSPNLTGTLDAQHDWLRFDAAGFLGGQRFALQSSLASQVNDRHSLGGAYAYQRSSVSRRNGYSHALSAVWTGKLSPRFTATASAGPSMFRTIGGSSTRWTVFAAAGVSAGFQRGSLALRYDRKLSPAYGFGRDRLVDSGLLGFTRMLGRSTTLTAGSSIGYSRDPDDTSFSFTTQAHSLQLRYSLGRRFALGGGATYRSRETPDRPVVHSTEFGLALTYGRQW